MPTSLKVFFDSDVIIAGSFSQTGASHVLLQLADLGVIRGYVSEQVIEECRRNIIKKLPVAMEALQSILETCFQDVVVPSNSALKEAVGQADAKDIPILAAALEVQADVLTTFNTKDYNPRESLPEIMRPGDLLKLIQRIV